MTGRHAAGNHGASPQAIASVLVAAMLFSTGGAARALAGFVGTANEVACWRVVGGGLVMAVVATKLGSAATILRLMRSPWVWLMAASVVLYQVTFFTGAQTIGIGVGTLIAQAVAPAVAGMLSWISGAGRPTAVWLLCTVTAIVGMTLITGVGGQFDATSVALVASSGALYSLNVVVGARLVRRTGATGVQVLTASFALGACIAAPVALQGLDWVATPRGVATVAWVGVMATGLAYILFGYGITHLPAPTVSTLAVSEPVWAALIGAFLLREPITLKGWLGCAVIIGSLAALSLSQARAKSPVAIA